MGKSDNIYIRVTAYLDGKLTDNERIEFEQLVKDDPVLKKMVESVRASREQSDYGKPGLSSIIASAHKLLDRQLKEARKRVKRNSQALTIHDSSLNPSFVRARDISTDSRRLKYRTGDITLSMTANPVGYQSFEIIGVLSEVEHSGTIKVKLTAGKQTVDEVTANEHRLFRFEKVEKGSYTLKIYLGRKLLMTADLDL